jgi:hypothetical protein
MVLQETTYRRNGYIWIRVRGSKDGGAADHWHTYGTTIPRSGNPRPYTEAYHANIIAESIYAKLDDDGYTILALKEITDHRTIDGTAVRLDDAYIINKKTGKKRLKQTQPRAGSCV